MDLVKLCLAPWCSCMQNPVVREDMSYAFCTKEKLDRLESTMKDLVAKKHDIERELNLPQNRGKQPTNQLQRWVDKVGEKDEKVIQLLDEYSKSCVLCSCLKYVSRYRISRSAINLLEEITQLKGEQLEISFIEQQPPKLVPESYDSLGKRISSSLDLALSYLADETIRVVGIWGMGGVGKSTLLKKINQSLLDNANMGFDHVLFIVASQNIQLEKVREEIAKKLQLASSASKEDIFNVLKSNNFVVLLDNIWEEADLIDLGIPHPYSNNNSTKQYKHKVIFTTRSEDVCARMGASKRIKMKCLEPDEAWYLFKNNVKLDAIESDEKFKKIARQVMNRCGRLPLALKVIGKAMSNKKTIEEWKFILSLLKNSGTPIVQGVQESLLPILKFSYDNLPNNMNIKECFLCASMLPGAFKNELLECWMGFGHIGDFVNLQQAYAQAESIFKILEELCLLHFFDRGRVRFHNVIYEMAIWIASDCGRNRNKWILKSYDGFAVEVPIHDAEHWRFANRVIIGNIKLLPILSHQCSDLLCLIIQNSFQLEKIPKGFFRQLTNLAYLDLSGTRIKKLPKDIKHLVNLQHLNISSTDISSLSKELVYLKKLQYMICRNLRGLGRVEDGLMSRLQNLKVIDLYPTGWVGLEELHILKKHIKAIGMLVVSQEVLQQLSCLPTTRLCLYNLDSLISLPFDSLSCKNYGFLQELLIGSCPQLEELVMNGNETHLSDLRICKVENLRKLIWRDISPPNFFPMLKKLFIYKCKLENFAWVLHLPCLLSLVIKDCAEIETLFYVEEREIQQEVSERSTFPALQSFSLIKLPKLVSISNFALDFSQLSRLSVEECSVSIKMHCYSIAASLRRFC
ncbi:P-loop containing nucleoside triphosphate hydrolase protein [Dioscorea alata]|uniref:P-loop containing nucleoside triphosphate hydrolase protein n=1 Tax=Dioscorea alata TaxID=55571 RepID=A0ACB7V1K4_DIOAL|nr:P-loop containing nucleoside triphosphate hydrolase protein [Dioscorea alata]